HPALPGDGPAALSYRELTGGAVPAARRCWVALQVLRVPDADPDADTSTLQTDLANSARRVVRRLRRAGLRAVPVTPEDAVVGVLGLLGDDPEPGAVVRAGWSSWTAGPQRSTTSVLALPGAHLDELPAVLAELRARVLATSSPTMLAVAARRGDDGVVDT
ncbi:type VII secretion protein EccE, partial [Curtobacterium sp. P97]|uniref:type VII secretion protein EccE n=1 Tax=Curtobacterium sp. P97 TaxID=2939562 RepID=UPI00203C0B59